jgi:CheY-like chemotaxis protein
MSGISPLILVVDDDELVRVNLQIVRESLPDLVVLDISMPEMDGWEALERMRAEPAGAGLPVLALTGDNRDPREFRRAGFNAYLSKGGSLENFLCTVRAALEVPGGRAGVWLHSCNGKRCLISPAWEAESLEESSGMGHTRA